MLPSPEVFSNVQSNGIISTPLLHVITLFHVLSINHTINTNALGEMSSASNQGVARLGHRYGVGVIGNKGVARLSRRHAVGVVGKQQGSGKRH